MDGNVTVHTDLWLLICIQVTMAVTQIDLWLLITSYGNDANRLVATHSHSQQHFIIHLQATIDHHIRLDRKGHLTY